jgi:hypothetical protein
VRRLWRSTTSAAIRANPTPPTPAPHRGEGPVADLLVETDGFEQFAAAIGGDGADAHLRHDLEQALLQRRAVVLLGFDRLGVHLTRGRHGPHLLDGEVGIDPGSAESDQAGEVVRVARLAGDRDERRLEAQSGGDEVVMDGPHRQGHGDRCPFGIHLAVGDQQDGGATPDRRLGGGGETVEGGPEPGLTVGGREERLQPRRPEGGVARPGQLLHVGVAEDARRQFHEMGLLRRLLEQRATAPDVGPQRHDEAFPDGVHRRVGDLGERLVEEAGESLRHVGQRRQARVVAHRQHRLDPFGHLGEDEPALLGGVPEHPGEPGCVEPVVLEVVERVGDVGRLGADPLAVGLALRQPPFDLRGEAEGPRLQVDDEHLTGAELAGGRRQHLLLGSEAGLGRHQHEVGGDGPPGRTQAVAVETGEEGHAVAGGEGGRAVPRLGEEGVVLVEGAQFGVQVGDVLPRRRDQHLLDMGQGASRPDQHLEGVVEAGRVAALVLDQGHQVPGPIAPHRRRDVDAPCPHPGPVRLDGVDLAVVGEDLEGLRQRPRRRGVGRVALMEDHEVGLVERIDQVPVEVLDVRRGEQALVDDRPARGGRDGEPCDTVLEQRPLSDLAGEEQAALETVPVGDGRPGADDRLLDDRHRSPGLIGQRATTHRDLAPHEHRHVLACHRLLDHLAAAVGVVPGQEGHHHAQGLPRRDVDAAMAEVPLQQAVGHAGHDPGAVPGPVHRLRAPVVEVVQAGDPDAQHAIGGASLPVRDEPDAAGVVVIVRVVQGQRRRHQDPSLPPRGSPAAPGTRGEAHCRGRAPVGEEGNHPVWSPPPPHVSRGRRADRLARTARRRKGRTGGPGGLHRVRGARPLGAARYRRPG